MFDWGEVPTLVQKRLSSFFGGNYVSSTPLPPNTHTPSHHSWFHFIIPWSHTVYLNSTRKGSTPLEHLPLARLIKKSHLVKMSPVPLKGVLPKESSL